MQTEKVSSADHTHTSSFSSLQSRICAVAAAICQWSDCKSQAFCSFNAVHVLQVDMATPGAAPTPKYRKDYKPVPYKLDQVTRMLIVRSC